MEVVLAIAAKIAECTVEPIGRQIGYIIWYKSNLANLKSQVSKLEKAKEEVIRLVGDATQKGEEIEVKVQNWLKTVDGAVAEAKKLHDNTNVRCSNMWLRHQLSRKARKMAQGVSEVLADGKFERISYRPPLSVVLPPSARDYDALESRTSVLHEIMQALKDDSMYLIGVCGMGGVGKTTLVKELAWQAEQDGSFGAVVVSTVTNSPDVKNIQGEIADKLGLKFEEETEMGRACRLRQRIRKEKSILVILDDIWKRLDLIEVGIPFGEDHEGCKLLLTSRNLDVLRSDMGTQQNFKLEVLSKKESSDLFKKMAGNVVTDINFQNTAIEVAERCAGLPLLIVTVAKALKGKELYVWKDALKQLTKFDHERLLSKVYSAIEFSYNCLDNDELRSFFLFIGSYSKSRASTEFLFVYCWALDLYQGVEGLRDAKNRHFKLINDLKASCLLVEEEGWVKMHDHVREVATIIASRDHPFFVKQHYEELKEWPNMDFLSKCHCIYLRWCYIHELPESLECPELKILFLNSKDNFMKVPDYFFANMRELKVLELGGLNCIPSPPPSLRLLKNLRVLCLFLCLLEDMAIVAELKSLEILYIENYQLKELPIELAQLTNLRLLNLSTCTTLRVIPSNLISSLTLLEELYLGCPFIQWEVEGSKNQNINASLGELRHLHQLTTLDINIEEAFVLPKDLLVLGNLERYRIYVGDVWRWSRHHATSRTLKLKLNTTDPRSNIGLKLLLNSVEDLYVDELKGVRNVLGDLNGEGFPVLKHLHIQNNAEMQYIINSTDWVTPSHAFPNLENLVIHNMINLEKICHGPLPIQSCTKLKVIKVKGCDKLKNLLSSSMFKELSQLVEIEISECKFLTEVILKQSKDDDDSENDEIKFSKIRSLTLECLPMLACFYALPLTIEMESTSGVRENIKDDLSIAQALFDEKIAFHNLESLKLSSINLRKIWDDQVSTHSSIQNLSSLTIDGCGNLKYLFSPSLARGLVKLQYLKISRCQMLDEIFASDEKMGNLPNTSRSLVAEEATFPSLKILVISHMDYLKSVWTNEFAPNSFCKLSKFEISFCHEMLNVFPSYVLNHLINLETLLVTDCDSLRAVFEIEELNTSAELSIKLRTLTLEFLPMLKHIWSKDPHGRLKFLQLCTVKASECESLNHVFPLSVAKNLFQLQKLELERCGVLENIIGHDEMAEAAPRLVFPQLTSLKFSWLEKLRSFYSGMHTFVCPKLKKLDVYHCDMLEVFTSKSQDYLEHTDEQPLFSFRKVIPNIEELSLSSKDVTMIYNGELGDYYFCTVKSLQLLCFHDELDKFPFEFLQRFTNLENLEVACSSFINILSSESPNISHTETNIKLKSLQINGLTNLEYLCKEDSQIQPIFQNLEILEVRRCRKLKNLIPLEIYDSPRLKSVVSSSVLFENLDRIVVYRCSGLVNLIASPIARNLLKIRDLIIEACEMIEEIVSSEEGDTDEIAFMKLEYLELSGLSRLTSFCKGNHSFNFPLLRTMYMVDCPMMETFSLGIIRTPMLKKVRVTSEEVWYWDDDLNSTITQIFNEKNSEED